MNKCKLYIIAFLLLFLLYNSGYNDNIVGKGSFILHKMPETEYGDRDMEIEINTARNKF
jgi:hypothetical protein